MKVNIDIGSGFCFGVHRAIALVEEALIDNREVYCLGELVHNEMQLQVLKEKGLKTISDADFTALSGKTMFLRAHGEPPSTYQAAEDANIHLIDATCPIVLKLQEKVKFAWQEGKSEGVQIVIYGKPLHAEVVGLNGVADNCAIIISNESEIHKINFSKPVALFSQTTMDADSYYAIASTIENEMLSVGNSNFKLYRSICSQVSGRVPQLKQFALQNDVILFVSGLNSSNGKFLFSECLKTNPKSYLINSPEDIDSKWLYEAKNVGVTGATSTPSWLIKKIADFVQNRIE